MHPSDEILASGSRAEAPCVSAAFEMNLWDGIVSSGSYRRPALIAGYLIIQLAHLCRVYAADVAGSEGERQGMGREAAARATEAVRRNEGKRGRGRDMTGPPT
jgi:hypothetical protein